MVSPYCSQPTFHNNNIIMLGIAFSGGGITAAISAACTWHTLVDIYPNLNLSTSSSTEIVISTVSGGTIGYAISNNDKDKIQYTKYKKDLMLEDLLDMKSSSVEAVDKGEEVDKMRSIGQIVEHLSSMSFLKQYILGPQGQGILQSHSLHWWTWLIDCIFDSITIDEIDTGEKPWLSSFAYMISDEKNILSRLDGKGYLSPSSARQIKSVLVNMTHDGSITVLDDNGQPPSPPMFGNKTIPTLDALSFSSSFWSALIVSNRFAYALLKDMLIKRKRSLFEQHSDESSCSSTPEEKEKSSVVILDGGVVDTTGIVGLLHKQADNMIIFYNNNIPLSQLQSPISYLFGVETSTDSLNSLKGPELSQIFPTHLYPEVFANLTDRNNGVALLSDIKILPNKLGVQPYIVKSIVIFSNGYNVDFSFDDERIMNNLSSDWPDRYSFFPPKLDANLLCSFSDWKVRRYRAFLDPLLFMV